MTKITDLFLIGDHVSWITIKRSGMTVDIQKHFGIIDEINGTNAMIKVRGKQYRKQIPLAELENETRPYEPTKQNHKWPGTPL